MRWDELLDGLKRNGHDVEELDFMDNYGPIVRSQHRALEGRHVRCVLGVAEIKDVARFEAYLFASQEDAEEFYRLVGAPTEWIRVRNIVVRSQPTTTHSLRLILRQTMGARTESP